jgi:hypothetical protein
VNRRPLIAGAATLIVTAVLAIQAFSLATEGAPSPITRNADPCAVVIMASADAPVMGELMPGDRVDLRASSREARWYFTSPTSRVGETFSVNALRGNANVQAHVAIAQAAPVSSWLVGIIVKAIIFLVGLLVLWRGRDLPSLFFGISSLCIAIPIYPSPSGLSSPSAQISLFIVTSVFAEIAALCLYLMVEQLARNVVSPRALQISRMIVVAATALLLIDDVIFPLQRVSSGCVTVPLRALHLPAYMAVLLAMLVVLTIGYVRSKGEARQRLRWIYFSTAVGFSGVLVYIAAQLVGRPIPAYPVTDVTAVAIPLGYSYAILRHRVIDVGFVVNRAIVFTATSSVVFGVFALLSALIDRAAIGAQLGLVLDVALALVVAFGFKALQDRFDALVDRLFYRRKYEAETALKRLAEEAQFTQEPHSLAKRTASELCQYLGASAAAVYEEAPSGYHLLEAAGVNSYPSLVSVDDAAFVRMRTHLHGVDLTELTSALGPGSAFPLVAHARLTGAIACAPRASEEPYDPDERKTVTSLARELAVTLETMRARASLELVQALGSGLIDPEAARVKAQQLLESDS